MAAVEVTPGSPAEIPAVTDAAVVPAEEAKWKSPPVPVDGEVNIDALWPL